MKKPDWAKDLDREPDWDEWRFIPEVQLWQAVALSLNIAPGKEWLKPHSWHQNGVAESVFDESDEFNSRLRVLRANFDDVKQFPTKLTFVDPEWCSDIRLDEFAAWVLRVPKWEIPSQLAALAKPSDTTDIQNSETPATREPPASRPWLIPNPDDPEPKYDWYTPARFFAREHVRNQPSLLEKRLVLADKVAKSLATVKVYKRGNTQPPDASTILKAFVKVNLA